MITARNPVHVYKTEDDGWLRRRGEMQWATRLQEAVEEDRLALVKQPVRGVIASDDGPWDFYEQLVRLRDRDTGNLVSPGAFLPAAERYSLVHLIDQWVIEVFAL